MRAHDKGWSLSPPPRPSASVLALGTFLLMLWDVPQRDVLISALLFVGFAIMVPLARTLAKDVEISGAPLPPPKDR